MQPTNLTKTFCNNLEKTILIKRKNDHRSYIDSVSSSPDRLIKSTPTKINSDPYCVDTLRRYVICFEFGYDICSL